MTTFETRLKDQLSAEDEAFLKNLEGGESLIGQLGSTFTGPLKLWTGLAFGLTFVFFALAAWSAFQIVESAEVREMIFWLAVFMFSLLSVAMLKMWFWMRMNHLALLRELKRIELRLIQGLG